MRSVMTIIGGIIIITIIIYVIYRYIKYPCVFCEHPNCSKCLIPKSYPVLSNSI